MIFDKVKACADELNISIRELERRSGLENGAISKWRTSTPRADNLQAVARQLNKPMEFFIEKES